MRTLKFSSIMTLTLLMLISCGKDDSQTETTTWVRNAVPVRVATAQTQTFSSSLSYNGSLEAIQTARIIPEIPGRIEALRVQIGDQVKQGDILVQMDISTLLLQEKQAEAGLSVAQANLVDAQKNWERVSTLRSENAVSQQQFEKMKLGLDAAQAQMNQAKAGLDLLKMQLAKASLRAPFSGVITQKGFQQGDLFSPAAMMPVYTLQNVSRIKLELQITSQEIMRIHKGQTAFLKVDYLEQLVPGQVTLVSIAADPFSKTFFVECQFDNSRGLLRAGTFGRVDIVVDEIENVVVIPRNSVINKSHIFVVEGDRAYQRDIQIVEESLTDLIVGSGLTHGEQYVIKGAYILTDSALVTIEE